MKKIFLKIFTFVLLFFWVYSYSFAELIDNSTSTIVPKEYVKSSDSNSQKTESQKSEKCSWEKCITSSSFMINVKDITPGWTLKQWNNLEKKVNDWLLIIIQKLTIPFWVLSVFVMTIWAWYMILHNWEEEILNKWKKIIKMWIFSIVIALSSYLIIELVKNIIY